MGGQAVRVELTGRQRRVLESLTRATSTPQHLAERGRVVLNSARGRPNDHQAAALGIDRQRVRRWRGRWAAAEDRLAAAEAEGASDKDLRALIVSVLSDGKRTGGRPKFSPEQVAAIISLACELPSESGLPVSHWTPPELAREAIKRGIVESISPRQVDRFLARRPSGRTRAGTG